MLSILLISFLIIFFHYHLLFSSTSGGVVALKTGRREVPGSIPGRACRPSRSEFSVVFSKTRVNTDQDTVERSPQNVFPSQAQVPIADNSTALMLKLTLCCSQKTSFFTIQFIEFTLVTVNFVYKELKSKDPSTILKITVPAKIYSGHFKSVSCQQQYITILSFLFSL